MEANNFQFMLLPAKNPSPPFHSYHAKTYLFWRRVWEHTFKTVCGTEQLYSDDFIRQDEAAVIARGETVVGIFMFSWLNLNIKAHGDHSYFKSFPDPVLQRLREHKQIMTMGYLSVDSSLRKTSSQPTSISALLLGLANRRFLDSDATALIAYTRNDRKTNELCYAHGAVPLVKNNVVHNIGSDIVLSRRENVIEHHDPAIAAEIKRLWRERIDYRIGVDSKYSQPNYAQGA